MKDLVRIYEVEDGLQTECNIQSRTPSEGLKIAMNVVKSLDKLKHKIMAEIEPDMENFAKDKGIPIPRIKGFNLKELEKKIKKMDPEEVNQLMKDISGMVNNRT